MATAAAVPPPPPAAAGAPVPGSLAVCVWSLLALLRVLVGYQPHSGQDDYHGLPGAYGGDFEVQRHWMELTWQLPVGEWYYYDPDYLGLDYPPLTAYVSYVCGFLSERLVGPHSVALVASRGLEDPTHKGFMRGTVLVLDLLAFGTAAWIATRRPGAARHDAASVAAFAFVMAQPALLLIDHGHFQYNAFALGLCLWAFHFIAKPGLLNCVIGSIFYCLALSFKQMTLYFAPTVFFYLLGRCCADRGRHFVRRFLTLGITVVLTLTLMFLPVVLHGPDGTTPGGRLAQVLRRIFPFQRGLFESKVANLWCVLSLKPLRIRRRLPARLQPLAALGLTAALLFPSCVAMFRGGRGLDPARHPGRSRGLLRWGTAAGALAFFLASFQVHEKGILMALAPVSLLAGAGADDGAAFAEWFAVAAAWSLWPLLRIDRLEMAYVCVLLIHLSLLQLGGEYLRAAPSSDAEGRAVRFDGGAAWSWLRPASYAAMVSLHALELFVTPPPHLPDLFPVLWSVGGCACFGFAWWICSRRCLAVAATTAAAPKEKTQ